MVARKAHNLEVAGSSPASATTGTNPILSLSSLVGVISEIPTRHTHDDIVYGTRQVIRPGDVGSNPAVVSTILAISKNPLWCG